MKRRATTGFFLALMLAGAAATAVAQGGASLPRPDKVVKPRAYVSLDRIPQGRTFEVAVVGDILEGFHINANKVLQDYLIPTTVRAEPPRGFKVLEVVYPAGKLMKFSFSPQEMSVYEGRVTLRLKMEAAADTPVGRQKLPIALRYQACNDTACLPPVTLDVPLDLEVAPAGSSARTIHPEIFKPTR